MKLNFLNKISLNFSLSKISGKKYPLPYTLYLIPLLCLLSCSDDLDFKPDVIEGEDNTLTIYLPDVDAAAQFGATRAEDEINSIALTEAEEGKINNLYLYAFPTKDNSGEIKITRLTSHASLNISDQEYKEYKVANFKKGDYHIYLLANMNRYLDEKTMEQLTEDDIIKLVLNFNPEQKIERGYLPMYCLNTEVKYSNGDKPTNGVFTISRNTPLYADLTFLCSKVRYTILFDRTENGFSNQFSSNNVDFTKASANKLAREVKLFEQDETKLYTEDDLYIYEGISLNKVKYPSDTDPAESPYFNINNNIIEVPNTLSKVTSWTNVAQRAWQGVVYLPENLSAEKTGTGSYISLVSDSDELQDLDLQFQPRMLKRGTMYDLVAKLKKSDVEFECKVNPWTTQHLAYTLHGPYELVVEYTHIDLSDKPGYYFPVGYDTDTHISFDFPKIKFIDDNGEEREEAFYIAEDFITSEILDENGEKYNLNSDFNNHFCVKLNPNIPFKVLYDLGHGDKTYTYEGKTYKNEDLNYFHVVAGNLHKKITTSYSHEPYLIVTPQEITIDVHGYYLSGVNMDDKNLKIRFETNYQTPEGYFDFKFVDASGLVRGLGDKSGGFSDLQLIGDVIDTEYAYDGEYRLKEKIGDVTLRIENLIGNHDIWSKYREFTLKFQVTVRNPNNTTEILETQFKEVKIIIIPFNAHYIIHFKDFTGRWEIPHIYILQDLLLPADLLADETDSSKGTSVYAGKIVGYIEQNEGLKYNAAAQYVFTNNISFRGWKGYGGPDINDPYDKTEPSNLLDPWPNSNVDTEGFVMFGTRDTNGTWNDDYGYTVRTAISIRRERYNYDLNFNDTHVRRIENGEGWKCADCQDRNEYINIGLQHDYPGIVMEKETGENEGWWRYTLTGVAQPGKTMIIFANSETPWDYNGNEEVNRYPGSYNTGLALFDFEDNEGWFGYNGQNSASTTNTPHYFFDEKKDAENYFQKTR